MKKKWCLIGSTYGSLKFRDVHHWRVAEGRKKKEKKKKLFSSAYGSLKIRDRTPLPPFVMVIMPLLTIVMIDLHR